MYLAVDIGGTKTLVASLDNDGVIVERIRFETPKNYDEFIKLLEKNVVSLSTKKFIAGGVGVPGLIDRENGIGIAMGNLPWLKVPIKKDIEKIIACPVVIHNDAKLAGLSEAMLLKNEYDKVLFVTVSTGIGAGLITKQAIDPAFADSEPGKMPLEYNDKMVAWEDFASGRAIVSRFGKKAHDINDEATWKTIANDLALGLIDLIAMVQPQVVVIGGSVGNYLERFRGPLEQRLKSFETPLIPIPPIRQAQRPDDAVLYGCYDLAKSIWKN